MPKAEAVAAGLVWPEGPAILDDGRVAFVETLRSQVSVWDTREGVKRLAYTGGGPNAVCLGSDGFLYVTQNGGVIGNWQADELRPGSIQRVSLDGVVETVVTEVGGLRLRRPNDLAFGPDGKLYFTDPGVWDPVRRPDAGYLLSLAPDGTGEVIAEVDPVFPNGIVVDADGRPVWAESYTRRVRRRRPGGRVEMLTEFDQLEAVPDGLAVAADGSLYVTVLYAGGLRIVGADGSDRGRLDVGAVPSNCVFSGRMLYITDGGTREGTTGSTAAVGVLWRIDTEVAGLELFRGWIG